MRMEDGRANGLVVMSTVLCSVAIFAVVLRSVVRCFILRNFWWDDFTIIGAIVFTLAYLAEIIFLRSHGLGLVMSELTINDMIAFLKATLAVEVTYYMAVGLIKTSIVLLYLRFAVSETLRKLCHGTIIVNGVLSVVAIIVTLAQCAPLSRAWDITRTTPGSCIDTTAFFYTTSGFNIITDIWIIGLPVKALKGMNRPRRELLALFVIFGAGMLACIMSIIRLHSIYTFTLSAEPFRDAISVNVWSMIEINVAILCASIPALKVLISPTRLRQVMNDKRHRYRPDNSSDRYFSDQEHNKFVNESMAKLPASLINVETVGLTEVSPAVTTDTCASSWHKRKRSWGLINETFLADLGLGLGLGRETSYDEEEQMQQKHVFDLFKHPQSSGSVQSFCYAGELPGQKD